jgi:cytoskeletal protein CcmA (bactofilin family)
MKTITSHYKGNITIESDSNLTGMITGDVLLNSKTQLHVHGTVNGQITINRESKLVVYGTVNGDIINNGKFEIYGTVNGELVKQLGDFKVSDKAIVNKFNR